VAGASGIHLSTARPVRGVVAGRAALLVLVCFLVGDCLAPVRRFYRALAAALATAARSFPSRPTSLPGDVCSSGSHAGNSGISHSLWWSLPVVLLVWANSHGGSCWVGGHGRVVARRSTGGCAGGRRWRYALCWCAPFLCCVRDQPERLPRGPVLLHYRRQLSAIAPGGMAAALRGRRTRSASPGDCGLVLLFRWRAVRMADWLLFLAFAAAGLTAGRNTFLIGILGPSCWRHTCRPRRG